MQGFQSRNPGMGYGNAVADAGAFRAFTGNNLVQGGIHPLKILAIEKQVRQFF
jgi:hypothetical protein